VHSPRKTTVAASPDFNFENYGSLGLLRPLTESAKVWIDENVSRQGFQPYWPTVIIESRYINTVLDGIIGNGLVIR